MSDVTIPSRTQVRRKLQELFQQVLTDVPATHIKRARLADPRGLSPLLYITSAGANRARVSGRVLQSVLYIEVFVLSLLVDPRNKNWTEENAEDTLDLIESQISNVLVAHKSIPGIWEEIEVAGDSSIERIPLGGNDYIVELIPLKAAISS